MIKILYTMPEGDGWMKIIRMPSAISEHVSTSKTFKIALKILTIPLYQTHTYHVK